MLNGTSSIASDVFAMVDCFCLAHVFGEGMKWMRILGILGVGCGGRYGRGGSVGGWVGFDLCADG